MKYVTNTQNEIEFPDGFSVDELAGLMNNYFSGEEVDPRVLEAACVYFCTDFPGAESTTAQLEELCKMISEVKTLAGSSLDIANNICAILGGVGFIAQLSQAKTEHVTKIRSLVSEVVSKAVASEGWRVVCDARKQSCLPNTTSESEDAPNHVPAQGSWIVRNPGFLLTDKAFLAGEPMGSMEEVYVQALAIINPRFYCFEELRGGAMRLLTRRAFAQKPTKEVV